MLKVGAILGNRYEIIEKIGAGGMSIVYRARDTKLERSVTVKVLRDEFIADDDFVSRFKIEAQAAASLSHPNIVNVYDVGTEYDTYYIVMEYINGSTLKEIIIEEAPLENKKALNYALKIASALQHAHKNHIVHRDIKPQNILVTIDGELKVTDFGIAHAATSSTVTMTSTAIGSVHYFSPEQARGGYVDEKSDLYSLGIVMYEMVTGKLPFEGDSSVSIALKHINEDLPSISQINPNISKSLEGIILKATQKRVDQRYADVDSMILDMNKALNDPSGDFIEKKDIAFSTTQKISGDDLKTIREESKRDDLSKNEDDNSYEEKEEDYEEDDDYETDDLNKSEEAKVIISAIATAIAIIAIICTLSYIFIFRNSDTPKINPNIIPSLTGKTLEEANTILNTVLTSNEILIEVGESVESDKYAEGLIVSQIPAEGSPIQSGDKVTVNISIGTKKYSVPKYINMLQSEAEDAIYEARTFKSNTIYDYSDTIEFGYVMGQEPEAGTKAKLGTEIILTVSKGATEKTVTVPSLKGLTETRAISTLKEKNLVPDITYAPSESVEKGFVIKQLVGANKEISSNSTVGFIVSTGKPEVTKTTEAKTTTKESTTAKESTTTTNESTSQLETTTSILESTTPVAQKTTKTKTYIVNAPSVAEGVEKVTVRVYKYSADKTEIAFEEQRNISDFPFEIHVSGSGKETVQLYIDDGVNSVLQWDKAEDFDK